MSQLPLILPITTGVDYDGNTYYLFTSWLGLKVGNVGGWETQLNAVNNGNGTWTFTAQLNGFVSPFISPISATIKGDFSAPFNDETLFVVTSDLTDPLGWSSYVNFDNAINKVLNCFFAQIPNFGVAKNVTTSDVPTLMSGASLTDFYTAYGLASQNIPLQNLILLQFTVYAESVSATDPTLIAAITPITLLFKINNFNIYRQESVFKFF